MADHIRMKSGLLKFFLCCLCGRLQWEGLKRSGTHSFKDCLNESERACCFGPVWSCLNCAHFGIDIGKNTFAGAKSE